MRRHPWSSPMRPGPSPPRAMWLAAVSSFAVSGAASAQDPVAEPVTCLDEILATVAPFGVAARASAIAAVVMDEEALRQAPAATLGDVLNGMPGVRSTSFSAGASRPVIRGLAGPRVQVLSNG